MNKRLKALASSAGIDVRHIEKHADEEFRDQLAMFADLIIKECADLVQGCLGDFEVSEGEWIEREASDILLDHFEVK
jgi:hypothetical protein